MWAFSDNGTHLGGEKYEDSGVFGLLGAGNRLTASIKEPEASH